MFLQRSQNETKNMSLFEDILGYFSDQQSEQEENLNQQILAPYISVGWHLNQQQERLNLNVIAKKVIWDDERYFVIVMKEVSQIIVNERLQEIDEYKDQLLASVTHELKTPLSGILSIVEMAEQEDDVFVVRGQLELIKKSGQMLEIILNDILDYSRLQKQKLRLIITKFDVEKTVDEVINLVQIQFSKPAIQIKKQIDLQNTLIQSDSNRFKQIIFNLLTNAIKFTQKGSISVSITHSSQADCLSVTVSDTGVGIPLSLQKKLFQLYGTFDHSKGSNRHGVGLGLVITKNLVQLLGPSDQILLTSSVGKGSSFKFDIFTELNLDENSQFEMENIDEQEELIPINNNNTSNQATAFISCFTNQNNSIHLGSPRIQAQLTELQKGFIRNTNNNLPNSQQISQVFEPDYLIEQSPTIKNTPPEKLKEIPCFPFIGSKSPFYVPSQEKKDFRQRLNSVRLPSFTAQIPPSFYCDLKKRQRNLTLGNKGKNVHCQNIDLNASCIISNPNILQTIQHHPSANYSYFHQSNNFRGSDTPTDNSNPAIFLNNQSSLNKNIPPSPHTLQLGLFTPPLKPLTMTNSKISTHASSQVLNGIQTATDLKCNLLNKQTSCEIFSSPLLHFIPSRNNEIDDLSVTESNQVHPLQMQGVDQIFKTQKRILIVDDTYINITVLRMMLGKNPNLIIEEAFNGQQAIDKIIEFNLKKQPFNLVFMDVNMPIMDGLQAIEIIRQKIQDKEIPDLKIAVCSAFDDLESKMKCLKAGADIHISKPINKSAMEQQLLQLYSSETSLN